MWGVQPHEQAMTQTTSPDLFARDTKDATAGDVANAASAIQSAFQGRVNIKADLVRTTWSPEFLGKIVLTIADPSPERIAQTLDAVQKIKLKGLDIRYAGTWYRPNTPCDALAARSEAQAFERARDDVTALGAALALRPHELLLKRVRDAAPMTNADPYLCTVSIPRLPLSIYTAPRPVPPARFVVEKGQTVVYSMRDVNRSVPTRDNAIAAIGAPDAYSEAYVHLRVQSPALQFSSVGTAVAHPTLGGALVFVRVYGEAASAITQRLRADGLDALAVSEADGSSSVCVLTRTNVRGSIDQIKGALQSSLIAEGQSSLVDAIQAVPFAKSCAQYREAALAAAAGQARLNDNALAKAAGKTLLRPIAIVETAVIQDLVCGDVPRSTLEAMMRIEPLISYTYNPDMFGYVQASVEVDYGAH